MAPNCFHSPCRISGVGTDMRKINRIGASCIPASSARQWPTLQRTRNGPQHLARLELCAGSGRRKGRGLRDIRGVPLPCVTSVSTTSNLGLPRSVTSLGQSTLTLVLESLLRRRIPQRRCAFFLEQSLLFPRR